MSCYPNKVCCLLVTAFSVTSLCNASVFSQTPVGKGHQLGLIDMAHVFKNYQKFKDLTETLQSEISAGDAEMQAKVEEGKKTQELMKTFSVGSAEYEKHEGELLSIQADLKKMQLKNQREFARKEADIYKETYLEVREAIARYSEYYHYTVILRFDRSGVASAENPQEIVEGLNQQVLFHRNRDDLTDPILNYLNEKWKRSAQTAAPSTTK